MAVDCLVTLPTQSMKHQNGSHSCPPECRIILVVTVWRVGVRHKIPDPPTPSPSLISLNGVCGRKAPCFHGRGSCRSMTRSVTLRAQKLKTRCWGPRDLKGFPMKTWSKSEYSRACFTYYQGFNHCTNFHLPGPFTFIFFKKKKKNFPDFVVVVVVLPVLAVTNAGFCVSPQNEIGHSACCHRWLMRVFRAEI